MIILASFIINNVSFPYVIRNNVLPLGRSTKITKTKGRTGGVSVFYSRLEHLPLFGFVALLVEMYKLHCCILWQQLQTFRTMQHHYITLNYFTLTLNCDEVPSRTCDHKGTRRWELGVLGHSSQTLPEILSQTLQLC